MADNVVLNTGTGGATVASDDIGGFQFQRVKPAHGVDGTGVDSSYDAPFPVQDSIRIAALGLGTKQTLHTVFGRNEAVGTPVEEIANQALAFPTTAKTMRIKAGGNANDDAAGTNTRQVTIQGIDSNWDLITEAITTAGASASANTTASFFRVLKAWSSQNGSYGGSNAGAIVIESSDGATDMCTIDAVDGVSHHAHFLVPNNHQALLLGWSCQTDQADAETQLVKRLTADVVAAPMAGIEMFDQMLDLKSDYVRKFEAPILLPEKTEIWVRGVDASGTSKVTARMDFLLIAD